MTDIKLKPCPFCGGTAKLYRERGIEGYYGSVVRCEGCGAKAVWKQMSYTTACDHEAAEAWNRRAKDEQTDRCGRPAKTAKADSTREQEQ